MRNLKKLLSMTMAIVMICSTLAIGAQGAYHAYKDSAITNYDSIDQPVFTAEQLASVALDAVDAMLAEMETKKFVIPILNVAINLTSIDAILESAENVYNGAVWVNVRNLAGDLGENLDFSALYYADADDGFKDPTFTSKGCRRSTPGKSDLDVVYSLFQFIYDNKDILSAYGYGTLKPMLGDTLLGIIESFLPEVNDYLDAPNLLRGLLYDAVYDPDDENGLPDWEDIPASEKTADKYKADAMVQLLVDDLMVDLEESLAGDFEWGITMNLSGILDIDASSFYDVFEAALQRAYEQILVPLGNTQFKKFFYELAGVEGDEFDPYRITQTVEVEQDGVMVEEQTTIGYYLDDCADIVKMRSMPGVTFPTGNSLAADVEAGIVQLNILGEMVNFNYEIPSFNFAATETKEFISEFNNVFGTWVEALTAGKAFNGVEWTKGSMDELIPNAMKYLKEFVRQYGERYLSEFITLPTDDQELEALLAELNDLEDVVLKFGPELIEEFAPNILLPDNITSVRAIVTYALCELIADKVPEEDIYGKLQSGEINPNGDDGWKAVAAVIARYYLNSLINVNLPANLTFEQTVSKLVDWALTNYGGILDYAADLSSNSSLTAWQKLDQVIFGLVPLEWLPSTARVVNSEGKVVSVSLSGGTETIILDVLLGNLLDLKLEHLFDLFKRNAGGELDRSPVYVILSLVRRVLNCIIPGAMPTQFDNIESILTQKALGDIIDGLFTGLYEIRTSLIPGALPLVCMLLDLTTAQQIEDPTVIYPDFILSPSFSLSGTSIMFRNASSGLNTGWRDASGTLHQDKLYQVKIKSITTNNSAVTVKYNANQLLNGGDSTEFPVTGKLSEAGLVKFTIAYEILDESGSSFTSSPIERVIYTYVSDTNSDDDADYYTTYVDEYKVESLYYVDGVGINNHSYINTPTAYISSWSDLRRQTYSLARDYTDGDFNPEDALITYKAFDSTFPEGMVEAADWEDIVTNQVGYNTTSFDYFKVNVPQVPAEDNPNETVDIAFEDALATMGNGSTYTASVTHIFGKTGTYDPNVEKTLTRTFIFFNNYNIYSIVESALDANRQKSNYATSGSYSYTDKATGESFTVNASTAWDNYVAALEAALNITLAPRTAATFDATVYEAAANNLKRAAADLDACAVSAGAAPLEALREEYQPSNPAGMEYDDPDFNYMGSEDYVLFTWDRYKEHRNNIDSLINSQKVEEPGENATPEEIQKYQEALANIPTLKQFDVTYRGHMYEMNAERLIRRPTSKNYLNHAFRLVTDEMSALNSEEYTAESWANLERAVTFADKVLSDNSSDLRQTKVNEARRQLISNYKSLELKGSDPADYAQLDLAIADAEAILAQENAAERYEGLDALQAALDAAYEIPRDLLVDDQAVVDEAAQNLIDAKDALVEVESGLDFSPAVDYIAGSGYEWAPEIKDGYGDMGDFQFIDGLMIEFGDGIESLIATTGGAEYEYTPNENNSGYIGTGDTITLGETVYYIVVYGDVTGDGMIDDMDASNLSYFVSGELYDDLGTLNLAADLNNDQTLDDMDMSTMMYMIPGELDAYSFPQNGTYAG